MKKYFILSMLFVLLTVLLYSVQARMWTSNDGDRLEADFVRIDADGQTVVLKKPDGNLSSIPKNQLSQADQEYLNSTHKTTPDSKKGFVEYRNSESNNVQVSGEKYALLIGVNEYSFPIKSLKFCVPDVELLAETLQKIGFKKEHIIVVSDKATDSKYKPTGGNIRTQIKTICEMMGPNDLLVISFSGHGTLIDNTSYLCPSDASPRLTSGNADSEDIKTLVSREWAYEQLDKSKANQKLFIIDACREIISYDENKALGKNLRTMNDQTGTRQHGFMLMASCEKGQFSWELPQLQHGAFTYFISQGLLGGAKNEDNEVTILGLASFVSTKTKNYVYQHKNVLQTPTFKQSGEMSDFLLAKLDTKPKELQPGDLMVKSVNGVEFAFRWCPPNSFIMGSQKSAEEGRWDDEKQHRVTLTKGFWIMETEVTQKQWNAVMETNPSKFKGDNLPVESVSWNDCQDFCKKCTKFGLPVCLPSEAQWEYACRAGSETAYSWGNSLNGDMANCDGNNPCGTTIKGQWLEKTTQVKSYSANAWGVYDMHGNVWEWCEDWYNTYPSDSVTDPTGPSSGFFRVVRGGCWRNDARLCKSEYRYKYAPEIRDNVLGFRVVLKEQ